MSIRVDETKPDTEATEPVIPTTCSPEDLPDEELLYDLADLFKVFSDTTRITSPRQRSSYASLETRLSMFCNNISSLKSASHTSRRRTPTRPHIENGPTAASSQSARETASIIPTSRPGFAKCGTSTKSTA